MPLRCVFVPIIAILTSHFSLLLRRLERGRERERERERERDRSRERGAEGNSDAKKLPEKRVTMILVAIKK